MEVMVVGRYLKSKIYPMEHLALAPHYDIIPSKWGPIFRAPERSEGPILGAHRKTPGFYF